MIISMEYKIYKRSMSVDLSKGIVVCPSLFLFPFSPFLFYFYFFVASLALSIYLSFVLLGSFVLSSLGSFPHFRGKTLYITRSIEDISHFTKVLNIKKIETIMMYANVCLCQCSRICIDTSVSCRNYSGKAQLACGSSIKQKHV